MNAIKRSNERLQRRLRRRRQRQQQRSCRLPAVMTPLLLATYLRDIPCLDLGLIFLCWISDALYCCAMLD
jgi:hypothetical protein